MKHRLLRGLAGLALTALLPGLTACSQVAGAAVDLAQSIFPPDGTSYSLSQTSLQCEVRPGEFCEDVRITARVSGSRDAQPLVTSLPAAGADGILSISFKALQPDGSWLLTLQLRRDLPPGVHSGTISVKPVNLYVENPAATLSYRVTVLSERGQQPALQPSPQAQAWQAYAGNAAHTGAVEATLDASRFSHRWTRSPEIRSDTSGLAVADGRVLLSQYTWGVGGASQARLVALNEHDGMPQWQTPVTDAATLSAPALDGERLMVTTFDPEKFGSPGKLLSFHAGTGIRQYEGAVPGSSLFFFGLAPTLAAGRAYFGGRQTLYSADAVTAAAGWTASLGLSGEAEVRDWTPALGANMAFVSASGQLQAFRLSDGGREFAVALAGAALLPAESQFGAPVFVAEADAVLLLNRRERSMRRNSRDLPSNSLNLVDIATRSLRWSIDGQFATRPVVGRGVVYVGNLQERQLEARALADGKLLWAWPLEREDGPSPAIEDYFRGDLVLTNTHLFVATSRRTHAIDLVTHKSVWRYGMSGDLAVSDRGVLYILDRPDSATGPSASPWLTAINLQ